MIELTATRTDRWHGPETAPSVGTTIALFPDCPWAEWRAFTDALAAAGRSLHWISDLDHIEHFIVTED